MLKAYAGGCYNLSAYFLHILSSVMRKHDKQRVNVSAVNELLHSKMETTSEVKTPDLTKTKVFAKINYYCLNERACWKDGRKFVIKGENIGYHENFSPFL